MTSRSDRPGDTTSAPATHSIPAADFTCSCVPPLIEPGDTLGALRRAIATEADPMVSLTHLLRLCRDEHPTLWEHHADPRCRRRVASLLTGVVQALPDPGTQSVVSPRARHALAAALESISGSPTVVIAHAIAEVLDRCYGHSFHDWFRQRSPYQPAVGDPIPLDSPDLRRMTEMSPTSPPWRLANRLDETRRVRLAGAWTTQFRVVFDYGAFDALAGLISADTALATCHPNHSLTEFELPEIRGEPAFPVRPTDLGAQRERINDLLAEAAATGASIVVLPELCVTEELAHELEVWVRRPGALRLLVAGSFHHADPADPTSRANRALAWVRDHPTPLIQDKHSPADQPVTEDITPSGWPELRVHVTADGWHLVIAICRDLLNPHAVHALTEAGANLVLSPSMSETLIPFGGPVAQLVGSGQALVAVANNPAEWPNPNLPYDVKRPARALFGHPGFGQQTQLVPAPDRRLGLALLRVRSGQLGWHPADSAVIDNTIHETEPVHKEAPPAWAERLREHTVPPAPKAASSVTLRTAAVLVLVADGAGGPHVVLTDRATGLTHYPGQLVFPGGATEPGDLGSVDTALREAREEIGLDPTSVHVLGALPQFALPDSGFLVTPILAWAKRPRFIQPANLAEVAAIRTVLIGSAATDMERLAPMGEGDAHTAGSESPAIGIMTSAVLQMLAACLGGAVTR